MKKKIDKIGWNFDNSYTQLPEVFFRPTDPTPVKAPELVVLNESLASELGLQAEHLRDEEGIKVFAGNSIPSGSAPIAEAYAGHQFGHFTMLGDGRAVLLGEQITPNGERYDLQLKGAGRTPFSRGGDGRAALGPMLREYIISEAMHGLGIPTTRSLAVVTTGELIQRETEIPGAILTRVAASHIRVGTFQFAAGMGNIDDLRVLADYTIKRHYPGIVDDADPYLSLLRELIKRQADLIAKWQLVGFIHGVMNTDNMTISGETIDYGPCAFMDMYDPATVFSSIDTGGRYAYGNQPYIGGWNLARFAETLLPLLHNNEEKAIEIAKAEISQFMKLYQDNWLRGMRAKLGLSNEENEDTALVTELLKLMEKHQADYTNTFIALTSGKYDDSALFNSEAFKNWHAAWEERIGRQDLTREASRELMKQSNPAVIPRNHRVEEALKAAEDSDFSVMNQLLTVLADPFAHSKEQEEYATLPEPSTRRYRTFCGT